MKNAYLLFLYFLPFLLSSQIVPNGNFEQWELKGDFEIPISWNYHGNDYTFISKDTLAFDEEYAAKIGAIAIDGFFTPPVKLSNSFPIFISPTQITTPIKFSKDGGNVSITIRGHEEEGWQVLADTLFEDEIKDFLPVTFHLSRDNRFRFDSLSIEFSCRVYGNPLGFGFASMTIDGISASNYAHPDNPEGFFISRLFPNPASEVLFIENYCKQESVRYRIFDINGRLTDDYQFSCEEGILEIPLGKYAPGTYFIQHCLEDCILSVRKFVIAP